MTGSVRRRGLWRASAVAVIVLGLSTLAAGPYRFVFGSAVGSTAGTRHAPCLPGQEVAILNSPHIPESAAAGTRYNSEPPTSGPHFGFTVATGVYDTAVPPGLFVHAMEHGHIVIHYPPDAPEAVREKLRGLARAHGADVVLTPNAQVRAGVVLTAWGRMERLDGPDEARITAFVAKLANRYNHGWARAADC
ncbi:DUF3105 domain-containing protein [Nonomuraea sp. NBC_01738]|uniref:DUF3105 domain-containing protein n=1 Tax=Nonomuraea sp. NBC_01738 TaxID=2976003 RepID=UPI002E0EA3CE|nr:DUF3105 domain-containing protein [Nonomuraea sp. NBC_01738]